MAKLHELLAAFKDKVAKTAKIRQETLKVFVHNVALFWGSTKTTKAHNESRSKEFDSVAHKERATTVPERLFYSFAAFMEEIDIIATMDMSNTTAFADLIVDDVVIAKKVPAVTLLAIEREAKLWREAIEAAPTRDTSIAWDPAPDVGEYVYVCRHPVTTKRTEKQSVIVELAAATKEHKAQVKENIADVPVADITEIVYNGMISSREKMELLERCDKIIAAAKEAKSRANEADVIPLKIGDPIQAFILAPLKKAA